MLLFRNATARLNGPILSATAISDQTPAHQLAGDCLRTKVCHFIRARLLSAFHFLSLRSTCSDACLLLTRCFEQMALMTRNGPRWIQQVYRSHREQFEAEEKYQKEIFYPMLNDLTKHKDSINRLSLRSQIQFDLQRYIDSKPVALQIAHFQTELHRPNPNSRSSLKLLRHVLSSFDILKMTRLIYDLGQFYLLLHSSYAQLIEVNEFFSVTLLELHDRAEKRFQHSTFSPNDQHKTIIDQGIAAVNQYHQFAGGFIRPGACNETQRFTKIEVDTPVHYLVAHGNPDEGNIVMRILR